MKRIFFDARMINRGGIGVYINHLLFKLKDVNKKYSFDVLIPYNTRQLFTSDMFKWIYSKTDIYGLKQYFVFKEFIRKKYDIYFFPHFDLPLLRKPLTGKIAVVVHDLLYTIPEMKLGVLQNIYTRFMISRVSKISDIVITDSEISRDDIQTWVESEKIKIIYPGADHYNTDKILKYSEHEKNLLYVGNNKNHKNIKFLFKLFKTLKTKSNCIDKLICAGFKENDLKPKLIEKYKEYIENKEIDILGKVSEDKLIDLYKKSMFVCLVSLKEGFGFPVIEGMRFGTPGIVLSSSGMNSYFKKGLICISDNITESAEMIMGYIKDEKKYIELSNEAYEYSDDFKWEDTALKFMSIFEELI